MATKQRRLPPYCGQGLTKPFLYNPYQQALLEARRQRICPSCHTMAPCDGKGVFHCPTCQLVERSQVMAPKAFRRIGIVGGRRSGKTLVGAHAAREECVVPDGLGWICGPTYKMLHDSTMPTFFKIIPPEWVLDWSAGDYELTLVNRHVIQFRSLDDPERGRGMGPTWSWFDEPQKMVEMAWDVFRPSLTENIGNTIFTFTPNGFDWTWRRLWRPAFELGMPGFWMAKCRTLDNPWIQKYAMDEVAEALRTMPSQMFRQEYEADFVSFAGNIYDWEIIEPPILRGTDAIRAFIPEYPKIDAEKTAIIGIGGGVTHPFGSVLVVATERGLVVLDDYITEHRSTIYHKAQVLEQFARDRQGREFRWAADEEKKYIFQEFAQAGIGVIPTEHYLMTGVQRVQTWLYSKQLFFASTAEKTLDQMRGYRWHDIVTKDGQHSEHDRDYRKEDELPKALHSAVLAWPGLPTTPTALFGRDLSQLSDRVRSEIERMQAAERGDDGDDSEHLPQYSKGWPFGSDWGNDGSAEIDS